MTSSLSPNKEAIAAWITAAAGFAFAALCLASLSYDGSYYLLKTIQTGEPVAPHHRWLNHLIFVPVLWARSWVQEPLTLARIHGLACSVVPLLSLAACFAMLKGKAAPLRIWAAMGILVAPLPGQIVMVGEVTPALQAGWTYLAFVLAGCPGRWIPAALLGAIAAWGLHPVASPMFGLACAAALALAWCSGERKKFLCWAALFGIAALIKGIEALRLATDYERASLHASAWLGECISGLLLSPFAAILPAYAAVAVLFFSGKTGKSWHWLWGAALGLGIVYGSFPGIWGGSLSFRKFGILATLPLAVMATVEACRFSKKRALPERPASALVLPALLFAVTLGAMSLSWKTLCSSLSQRLAATPGLVQRHKDLPRREGDSALNHWSTTSLSLLIQGWNPAKVHVWNASLQQSPGGFYICPGDPSFPWNDGKFALAWLNLLDLNKEGR